MEALPASGRTEYEIRTRAASLPTRSDPTYLEELP